MIAVTGATGHIGNVLVRQLCAMGETVRAVVPPFESPAILDGLGVDIFRGDVTKPGDMLRACAGADTVFHLAGIIAIDESQREQMERVNVGGAANVLSACRACHVRRLVYVSSIHAFIDPPQNIEIDENTAIDPEEVLGAYAVTKAKAARQVLAAASDGMDIVIVHPTGVIGPYDSLISHTGQMIRDYLAGRYLRCFFRGAYDFVDVRDVVQGLILAWRKGRAGQNYILSGSRVTIRELFSQLSEVTGKRTPAVCLPLWLVRLVIPFERLRCRIRRIKPSITRYSLRVLLSNSHVSRQKAAAELGYRPRPIRDTLADTVTWLAGQKKNAFAIRKHAKKRRIHKKLHGSD